MTKNEKKKRSEGISEIENNTKAMLDQVGLVDALDNWFDGVLTIGTFGFDSLKFQEEEDEIDDDECENVDLDYVVIDGSIVKNINQELDPLISNENNFHDHHDDLKVRCVLIILCQEKCLISQKYISPLKKFTCKHKFELKQSKPYTSSVSKYKLF